MTELMIILSTATLIGGLFASIHIVEKLRASERRRRIAIDDFFSVAYKLKSDGVPEGVSLLLDTMAEAIDSPDWARGVAAMLASRSEDEVSKRSAGRSAERELSDQLSDEQLRLFIKAFAASIIASCERSLVTGQVYRELITVMIDASESRRKTQRVFRLAKETSKSDKFDLDACQVT